MGYIGNTPADKFLTLAKQNFSTSATTSYTLDSAVSSTQDIALFINNVRQSPVDAYSVSGTSLTLTSATAGTDEMYCVYLGKTVGTVSPSVNSITNAMMTDDSVGLAELSATGTPSSSNYLRGDNSWQTISGTTINTNADNRVITGSGTANTLNGEANLTFDSTDITVAGSGGIIFGSSGETLNSYEEGTWTPDMQTGGSNPSYATQLGYYVKVGKTCTVTMNLNYTSSSSNIGLWGGLPFTCNANGGADSRGWIYHDKNTTMYCALIGSNGTTFYIRPQGTYSGGLMSPSDFSGKSMMMTITYHTA